MTNQVPENAVQGEGSNLREAVEAGAALLGLTLQDVHYKLDLSHFKNPEGRNIGVDTAKVFVWARDPAELEACNAARAWMTRLLELMGFDGKVEGFVQGKDVTLRIQSTQAAHLVGRAGVTIDAIRTLLMAQVGHRFPEWRFIIDVEDPRAESRERDSDRERPRDRDRGHDRDQDRRPEREHGRDHDHSDRPRREPREARSDDRRDRRPSRGDSRPSDDSADGRTDEKQLAKMARKVAQRVMETGEPELIRKELNSYARRIVHMAISEFTGLKTESVGEGAYKQVRILPVSAPDLEDERTEDDINQDDLRPESAESAE